MNKNANPIEFAIEFAWANGCDLFTINNAKDELRKLKLNKSYYQGDEALDKLISLCEKAISTGKWSLTPSVIENAKANLMQIRGAKTDLAQEIYQAHNFATEEMNLYLETAKELGDLKKSLNHPVAWAKTNDSGDLYDLRLQNNPYNDQSRMVPLYRINHG